MYKFGLHFINGIFYNIPTYKNYKYCKLTIDLIKKNSIFNHEIIVHINGKNNETENYLSQQKIKFTNQMKILVFVLALILLINKAQKNLYYILMMICIFYLVG